MRRLEGRSIVITGAASGIGRAAALLFAEEGARLVLVDRSAEVESVGQAVRAAGGQALAMVKDAASEADVADVVDETVQQHGVLHAYYANAAVSGGTVGFDELSADDWLQLLSVNLVSAFLAIKYASRVMSRARTGSILCTASVAGLRAGGGGPAYSASKAGLMNLVQTAAHRFAAAGIRVNAICPGLIDRTGMGTPVLEWARQEGRERALLEEIPLGRAGRVDEVARGALYLLSDEASYVTGQTLIIDGGVSCALPGVPRAAATRTAAR